MPIQLFFVKAPALTLLTATPLSSHSPQHRRKSSYRVSTKICMAAKRTRTKKDPSSADLPSPNKLVDMKNPDDRADESSFVDPEDNESADWTKGSDEDGDEDDETLAKLLLNTKDDTVLTIPDDEELVEPSSFEDEDDVEIDEVDDVVASSDDEDEEFEEEEEDDDEEEEEDDDVDPELAARANGDDFDADVSIASVETPRRTMSARQMTLDPDDEDEDVDDVDDLIEPISDELEPIFEDGDTEFDEADPVENEEPDLDEEDDELSESFEGETEEEIQSAARILSKSGLLGLGVEGGKRADISAVKEFAMGKASPASELEEEFDDQGLPLNYSAEDNEDTDEGDDEDEKEDIDDYPDLEDEEDADFKLTSRSSFGRVWELNEDSYVTITEPGQSYAYELDEEDEEDQEMSSVRRGKQGGWSGGLASYSADNLPKGSREWIARRSYELMSSATPEEMFRWTRWHLDPPTSIVDLYPKNPPAPSLLGKTTLKFSSPTSDTPTIGKDTSGSTAPTETKRMDELDIRQNPLERSIKFPCTYKFKVEGTGDGFPECLRETVENVVKREMPDLELQVEPAGRYERVVIPVEVESAQQVTVLYDALRSNPSVKFSFG